MTPSATGTLGATPLGHALVYARNRRLSGRLEVYADAERSAVVTLWRGTITAVETRPVGMVTGGFFGAVAYELGLIDAPMLDATLLELAKTKRLHGEILVERGALTPAQRDEVLVEQIHRKIHHLFSFPDTSTYAFYDVAAPPISPPVALDVVGPVWRGVRDYPPMQFVMETMRRVGAQAIRATQGGSARLPPQEAQLLRELAARPYTLEELKTRTELPAARVELLVYVLVIAKCVEAVTGSRTHPSTGALPATMPSGPPPSSGRMSIATPASSSRMPAAMPSSVPRISITTPSSFVLPIPAPPSSRPRIIDHHPTPGSFPAQPASGSMRAVPGTLAALKTPAEYGAAGIVARAATIEDENHFTVLGVADGASEEAVRAAFIRLAKTWHPDKLPIDFHPIRSEIAKIFTAMTKAHRTLTDPDERRIYLGLRQSRAEQTTRPRPEVMRDVDQAMTLRNYELAMTLCDDLVRRDSDDAEALAKHAWATTRAGEVSEEELRIALVKLDRAVNCDRTCDEAVYHRGLVHKRLGNGPTAARDFARALQLNGKHVGAEREVRLYAMRVKKGSGEHKLIAPLIERLDLEARKR